MPRHGGAGMNITPEMIASLPPELQQEMQRRLFALMADLGVKPKITPAGQKVFDIAEVAAALGMSTNEAIAIAAEDAGNLVVVDPTTLRSLQ
jgi:hypothetical protein